jgi:hypothetical protein
MNIGMLWFDNDPRSDTPAKIERAASYYRQKYGRTPTLCFVNPKMAPAGSPFKAGDVEVRPSSQVLPNHLWIGVGQPMGGAEQ